MNAATTGGGSFSIATWNVNSLRVRGEQLMQWLADARPDVVALQETKMQDPDFPHPEFTAAGYHSVFSGQKTYNGVALLSRQPMTDFIRDIPDFDDPPRRVLAATIDTSLAATASSICTCPMARRRAPRNSRTNSNGWKLFVTGWSRKPPHIPDSSC